MELQFQKSPVRCMKNLLRRVEYGEMSQELRLTEGMPDIGRVLCSWGQVVLRSKEWNREEAAVSGGVMVWVLYAPEDGTEPRCLEGWIPFQLKWELPENARDGKLRICPLLRFVDGRSISPRKMMVRTGVAALCEAMEDSQSELYAPPELPEDVQILTHMYPVRVPREAGEKTYVLDEDLIIPPSAPQPAKLLGYTVRPDVYDGKVAGDKVVFRGTGNVHVIYRCPEGRIHTWDFEVPFSQYGELEGQYGLDSQVDFHTAVTDLELNHNEQGQLRLKCGLVSQYLVDERMLLEMTEDTYSPKREIIFETAMLEIPGILEDRTESVSARQTMPTHTGDMVDMQFFPDFPRIRKIPGEMEMEIHGMFQILYYGEDGSLQSGNARWETRLPFPADEHSIVAASIQPSGRMNAMQGPEGFDLSAEMQLRMRTMSDCGQEMVTQLELGELREDNDGTPSLILRAMGEDSLWNLAKRCGSTVAAIQRANGLSGEPESGKMLLIPVG